jgi:hypothetical protein
MFNPDNMVVGGGSVCGNWAKGYYAEGSDMLPRILDRVRREVE